MTLETAVPSPEAMALRESEQRFSAAVAAITDVVWTNDANGFMKGEQPGWCRFTGQTTGQVQDLGWADAIHPDDAKPTIVAWNKAVSARSLFVFEHRVCRHDGEWRTCTVRAVPVIDGDGSIREWVGVHTDITEHKLAEQALRNSEERFRSLVAATSSVVWNTDESGRFVTMQEAWSRSTGQGWEQMQDFGWLDAIHPDDRGSVLETWRAAVVTQDIFRNEIRVWYAPGARYSHFDASAVPVLNEDGGVREWVGMLIDIDERVHLEFEVRRRIDEAADQDRRKDEFLATLAHELRNPLAPIRNGLQILQLARDKPGTVETTRVMMDRQVSHMVRLIDDLLDLSRINRNVIELRLTRSDLAGIVRSAIETSQPLIRQFGHRFDFAVPDAPVWVEADVMRLAQVFANLLNNAAKYTEQNGEIRLDIETIGHEAVVSITDSGIGISEVMLPKVFDLFTQVDRSLEKTQGGLGIGLNIVRRLVEMHGGSVEAHSEGRGHGSRFVVRLPRLDVSAEELLSLASREEPVVAVVRGDGPVAGRRVLIVDDNRDSALSMATMLEISGGDVRLAYDGSEGVRLAELFRPQIVLLDIGMPKLNGYEACRRIRKMPGGGHTHIIAMTGWGKEDDRRLSFNAGFDGHLTKPVDQAELQQLLVTLDAARTDAS